MTQLDRLYRELQPRVQRVAVYPNIVSSSRFNPYLSLLYRDCETPVLSAKPLLPLHLLGLRTTVVHYHWLEFQNLRGIVVLLIKLLPLLLFALLGGAIVWTMHNSEPHGRRFRRSNKALRRLFARLSRAVLVHSAAGREIAVATLGIDAARVRVIAHPRYPVTALPKEQAYAQLKDMLPAWNGEPLLLMFGFIAPYKGIEALLPLFTESECALLVAGKPKDEALAARLRSATDTHKLHLLDRYITTEEEAVLFSACAAALFNFTEIVSSGSMVLAASYGTTIIAPPFASALPEGAELVPFDSLQKLQELLSTINSKTQ